MAESLRRADHFGERVLRDPRQHAMVLVWVIQFA
jgi:hypothetical protein